MNAVTVVKTSLNSGFKREKNSGNDVPGTIQAILFAFLPIK